MGNKLKKLFEQVPQIQKPSAWQMWMTGAMVFVLSDHLGFLDIAVEGEKLSITDLTALITALGVAASMFSRGRRGK